MFFFFFVFFIFSDRMTFRRFRKHGHHTAESSQHRNKETHLQLAEFLLFGFHVSGLWVKPAGPRLIAASLCVAPGASLSWRRGLQTKGRVPSRSSSLPIFTTACILGRLWQIVQIHFIRLLYDDVIESWWTFTSHPSTTWPCVIPSPIVWSQLCGNPLLNHGF